VNVLGTGLSDVAAVRKTPMIVRGRGPTAGAWRPARHRARVELSGRRFMRSPGRGDAGASGRRAFIGCFCRPMPCAGTSGPWRAQGDERFLARDVPGRVWFTRCRIRDVAVRHAVAQRSRNHAGAFRFVAVAFVGVPVCRAGAPRCFRSRPVPVSADRQPSAAFAAAGAFR